MRLIHFFLVLLLSLFSINSQSYTVSLSGTQQKTFPITVLNFGGNASNASLLSDVIQQNLANSGFFRIIPNQNSTYEKSDGLPYGNWRSEGADLLTVGYVDSAGSNINVRFNLLDTVRQEQMLSSSLTGPTGSSNMRVLAHSISDRIFEKVTGIPGVFSTKIAVIIRNGKNYELQIADTDGRNNRVILRSEEPIISPVWSPDGSQLAYVSFETGKSVVYTHNLASGQRRVVANFKGNNSAPAWSPDGRRLAVVLSRKGGSQMYLINADGSNLESLLDSTSIDTEPTFTPDGSQIYFTSDRSGTPQIYRITIGSTDAPQRVTYLENSQNTSPNISPDGKTLAFVTRAQGGFRIATLDIASGKTQIVTDGSSDLSPSFAPNNQHILFVSEQSGQGQLMRVNNNGNLVVPVAPNLGNVRHPVWGPMTTKPNTP